MSSLYEYENENDVAVKRAVDGAPKFDYGTIRYTTQRKKIFQLLQEALPKESKLTGKELEGLEALASTKATEVTSPKSLRTKILKNADMQLFLLLHTIKTSRENIFCLNCEQNQITRNDVNDMNVGHDKFTLCYPYVNVLLTVPEDTYNPAGNKKTMKIADSVWFDASFELFKQNSDGNTYEKVVDVIQRNIKVEENEEIPEVLRNGTQLFIKKASDENQFEKFAGHIFHMPSEADKAYLEHFAKCCAYTKNKEELKKESLSTLYVVGFGKHEKFTMVVKNGKHVKKQIKGSEDKGPIIYTRGGPGVLTENDTDETVTIRNDAYGLWYYLFATANEEKQNVFKKTFTVDLKDTQTYKVLSHPDVYVKPKSYSERLSKLKDEILKELPRKPRVVLFQLANEGVNNAAVYPTTKWVLEHGEKWLNAARCLAHLFPDNSQFSLYARQQQQAELATQQQQAELATQLPPQLQETLAVKRGDVQQVCQHIRELTQKYDIVEVPATSTDADKQRALRSLKEGDVVVYQKDGAPLQQTQQIRQIQLANNNYNTFEQALSLSQEVLNETTPPVGATMSSRRQRPLATAATEAEVVLAKLQQIFKHTAQFTADVPQGSVAEKEKEKELRLRKLLKFEQPRAGLHTINRSSHDSMHKRMEEIGEFFTTETGGLMEGPPSIFVRNDDEKPKLQIDASKASKYINNITTKILELVTISQQLKKQNTTQNQNNKEAKKTEIDEFFKQKGLEDTTTTWKNNLKKVTSLHYYFYDIAQEGQVHMDKNAVRTILHAYLATVLFGNNTEDLYTFEQSSACALQTAYVSTNANDQQILISECCHIFDDILHTNIHQQQQQPRTADKNKELTGEQVSLHTHFHWSAAYFGLPPQTEITLPELKKLKELNGDVAIDEAINQYVCNIFNQYCGEPQVDVDTVHSFQRFKNVNKLLQIHDALDELPLLRPGGTASLHSKVDVDVSTLLKHFALNYGGVVLHEQLQTVGLHNIPVEYSAKTVEILVNEHEKILKEHQNDIRNIINTKL